MIKELRKITKGGNSLLNESKVVKINVDFMSKLLKRLSLSEQRLGNSYQELKRATFEKCDCRLLLKRFSLATILFSIAILSLFFAPRALAGPTSTTYQVVDYGFGAGGIATTSGASNKYMLQGIAGELEFASPSSSNYMAWPGLTYTEQPAVPSAPTFTNPSNYYNKLHITINQGSELSDTVYAISISTDNFASNIKYVQADETVASVAVWQSYGTSGGSPTAWHGSDGIDIIGLTPGTTYYARIVAGRGTFTQGVPGPTVSAATVNPKLTYSLTTTRFSAPPYVVVINNIDPGGAVKTSDDQITANISTNGANGGSILVSSANGALVSTSVPGNPITSATNNLDSVSQGYGAQGVSVSQSSGGPLALVSPYNTTTGNNVGILDTNKRVFASSTVPVTNGSATFVLKAKVAAGSSPATDYTDKLIILANGAF
ncbi:MAG: hypothetical protein ABSE17_03225 [Candidatus Levyibacteriota bacterium]|jgi:hypothetical protein